MCNECGHIINAILATQLLQKNGSQGGEMDFVNGNVATLLTQFPQKRGHTIISLYVCVYMQGICKEAWKWDI